MPSSNDQNQKHLNTDHLLKDLSGHTAHNSAVVLSSQLIKFTAQVTSISVLARLLGPEEFGLVAMVTIITNLLAMFKDGGLSMATIQKENITHQQVSNLFWVNAAAGLFLSLLTITFSPIIARIYSEPQLVGIAMAIAATFFIGGLSVQHEAVLKRQMQFKSVAIIDIGSLVVGILTGTICAWLGMGYWALVYMQVATSVTQTIIAWHVCKWRPARPKRGSDSRQLVNFGLHITGANFIGYLSSNITPFFVGYIGGPQQMGYFNRAVTLASMPGTQVLSPLMNVSRPAMSRLAPDKSKFASAGISLIAKMSMLAMFVSTIMFVWADVLIGLFLGPGWEPAVLYTRLLAIGLLAEPTAAAMVVCVLASGHAKLLVRVKIIQLFVIIIAVLIGQSWGAQGVVAAYATSGILVRLHIFLWMASHATCISLKQIYLGLSQVLGLGATLMTLFYGVRIIFIQESMPSYIAQLTVAALLCPACSMLFPRCRRELLSTLSTIKSMTNSKAGKISL